MGFRRRWPWPPPRSPPRCCPPSCLAGFFLAAPEGRLGATRLGTQGLVEITGHLKRPDDRTARKLKRKFEMATVNKSDKNRVIIFDTTLRDGEQCPGASMT